MKKTAEHYIEIYCTYYDANALNRELAVLGPTILGKMVDHQGEMPSSSGYYHDVISGRIDKMKKIHPDFMKALQLVSSLPYLIRKPCVCWQLFKNRKPADCEKTLTTGKAVAEYLGYEYDKFRQYRAVGLEIINYELKEK